MTDRKSPARELREVMRARAVREAAGLTAAEAGKKVRVSANYLLACERKQQFSYYLAQRLAHVYGCRLDDFLPVLAPAAEGDAPTDRPKKPARKRGAEP